MTLGQCGDALGPWECTDEGLRFFVLIGGAEGVQHDGVGAWEDELVLAARARLQEERVTHLSNVVCDVLLHDGLLEAPFLYFHFVT